jgi:hypothetical protein
MENTNRSARMAASLACRASLRYGEAPCFLPSPQGRRQAVARADVELVGGIAEVHLDDLAAHEQGLSDLTVRRDHPHARLISIAAQPTASRGE